MSRYPQVKNFVILAVLLAAFGGFLMVGGRILSVIPCANGKLLYVGPPRAGAFLFGAGSRLYRWYSLRPGAWVLGTASPGGACICPYNNCKLGAIPAKGTIIMLGTSR